MNISSSTVGIREYVAIVMLIVGVKLADSTPTLYFDSLKSAAWMAPLIEGIITIFPLYFLIKILLMYKNQNLYEITLQVFGKHIGFLLSLLFWIYGSIVIAVDSRSYVDIISTIYFVKTPTIAIYVVLMVVCAYIAKKGLQNLGSLSWTVFLYIKITLLLALVLTLKEGNTFTIFPLFGPGIPKILAESILKTSLYGDILYMGLIFPYLASNREFAKGSWIALVILTVELTFSFLIFLFMFDYMPATNISYPFHEVIRYIKVGEFLTSIDTLFFPFWILASLVRFSVYLYLNGLLFGLLFKIDQFEYAIPVLATVFLILGMIPETPSFTIFKLRDPLYQVFTPAFIIFPFLLWLLATFRGGSKIETQKNNG